MSNLAKEILFDKVAFVKHYPPKAKPVILDVNIFLSQTCKLPLKSNYRTHLWVGLLDIKAS